MNYSINLIDSSFMLVLALAIQNCPLGSLIKEIIDNYLEMCFVITIWYKITIHEVYCDLDMD